LPDFPMPLAPWAQAETLWRPPFAEISWIKIDTACPRWGLRFLRTRFRFIMRWRWSLDTSRTRLDVNVLGQMRDADHERHGTVWESLILIFLLRKWEVALV
jgi:hypothetical protein